VITQTTSFLSDSQTLEAYIARPDGDGPFPGVLVIHEIFGLNDNMRDIARRFADQGYAALAVDLFASRSRVMCMFRLFAGMQFNSLEHRGIQDLRAALDHLAQQPGVDPDRLGAVGYCLGGGLAIALACTDSRLKAIAPYYGSNPRPIEAVHRSCPVVGSYPERDFTTGAGKTLDLELDKCGVPHDIKIYQGAKHSFFNDQRSASYDPAAAGDSWERVLAFFHEHVR
jgi:carboxymethylenebutenolidase